MKILFCTNAFENITNGPAKFANLILEINELYPPHQVRVLTEDVSDARLPGLKYVYKVKLRIPVWLKPLGQILRMFTYYQRIREITRDYDFDLLIYNNAFTGLYASRVSDRPTIGMINDEKNLTATRSNFALDRWWIKKFLFRQLEKWSTRSHRLIIVNSDYLYRKVVDAYQVPPHKVRRLYKSIDLSQAVFQPVRAFGSPVKVLYVKADYRNGQLGVLIKALSLLPAYQFTLTVIGPEPQFKDHVLSLFRGVGNVQPDYLGPQPQRVVYEYLRSYDIFCVPSATEALGVANIEALAHGIPVISTRVGGIPEVLDGGSNGWLVASGNAPELARAFEDCIQHPASRATKSQNGKNYIRRFSKDQMLSNFMDIAKELSRCAN